MSYEKCRICLKFHKQHRNIFTTIVNGVYISKMIFDCASVQVLENDSTINVCDNCLLKVVTAYQLRSQIIESDLILKKKEALRIANDKNWKYEKKSKISEVAANNSSVNNETIIKEEYAENEDVTISPEEADKKSIVNNESIRKKGDNENKAVKIRHKCEFCDKSFTSTNYLKAHIRGHLGDKPFECETCRKCFTLRARLNKHKKMHAKILKCDTCDKTFTEYLSLIKHKRIHKEDISYICELCGKQFPTTSRYKEHKISHTEAQLPCSICGKLFKKFKTLKYHERLHEANIVKNYCCKICEKKFATNRAVKVHMEIHKRTKLFSCKVCGRSFKQSNSLKLHMRMHTGETPYKCSICSQAFSCRRYWRKHMTVHKSSIVEETT